MRKTYYIETLLDKRNIPWENIPLGLINENGWNSIPKYESYFQVVFVKDYGFLIKLTTKEKNPWANYINDNDPVYLDSCLEAFLLFDNNEYINLEYNSLGAKINSHGKDRFSRRSIIDINLQREIITADDSWSIVIEVPLSKLLLIYPNLNIKDIDKGYSFMGNFYKTGKNPIDNLEHYYMWNRVDTLNPDFHQPTYFGELIIK